MSTQAIINRLSNTALLFAYILITGCGGGADESTPTASTAQENITTEMITASESFNFALEHQLHISIVNPAGYKGAIHLYHEIDHQFADGSVVPDPQSRITTIDPTKSDQITLSLNKNITRLIWHWVSTQRDVAEQIEVIEIENNTELYLIHL